MESKKVIGVLISSVFLISLGYLFPQILIFGNAEIFNEELSLKLTIYQPMLIGGVIIALLLWFTVRMIKKNNKFGDSMGYYGRGERPAVPWFKRVSTAEIYFASMVFFAIVFLIAQSMGAGTGTEVRFLPQQFTQTDNVWFSLFLIVFAENIFILAIAMIASLLLQAILLRLTNLSPGSYTIYDYAIFILTHSITAWVLHRTVYSGSDVAGLVVLIFWGFVGFLNKATGEPYAGIAFHQMNNLPLLMAMSFASSSYITVSIIIIVLSLVAYAISRTVRKKVFIPSTSGG